MPTLSLKKKKKGSKLIPLKKKSCCLFKATSLQGELNLQRSHRRASRHCNYSVLFRILEPHERPGTDKD